MSPYLNFDFVVENSRHKRLSPRHAVRMFAGSMATIGILQSAETTDIVDVNNLYDFSLPGTYHIQATRRFAPGWRIYGSVVSNWVQVTVQSESEYREPVRKRSQSLGLYVKPEREDFQVGENIFVEVELKSLTSRTVSVDHSDLDRDYGLKVSNEQGQSPPLTRKGIRLREIMLRGFIRTANELKEGEKILSVIDASSVYQFDVPGFYWIEISRTVPGQEGSEREEVVSNRFRIRVIR
jgi:hypothetical protein